VPTVTIAAHVVEQVTEGNSEARLRELVDQIISTPIAIAMILAAYVVQLAAAAIRASAAVITAGSRFGPFVSRVKEASLKRRREKVKGARLTQVSHKSHTHESHTQVSHKSHTSLTLKSHTYKSHPHESQAVLHGPGNTRVLPFFLSFSRRFIRVDQAAKMVAFTVAAPLINIAAAALFAGAGVLNALSQPILKMQSARASLFQSAQSAASSEEAQAVAIAAKAAIVTTIPAVITFSILSSLLVNQPAMWRLTLI
jgi:hypothetical protein